MIAAALRPKRVMSWHGPFELDQLLSTKCSQRWPAAGNAFFYLTCSRLEAQTSRSRDESVTDRPAGRLNYCQSNV